ncbi:unnamed protein product [Calicophoron daubneyi]|uniref:Synaptogyrin n=1 Tax=Calicophoron daubneyi TaxID=300641 RepID=A0AAV2TVL7_CALDB
MDPSRLFSAAKPGGGFNALEFFRQPIVILRCISVLFSIIVFGCITSGCHTHDGLCIYDDEPSACRYGTMVGVIGFLGAVGLLVTDGMFNSITNVKRRRHIIMGDLAFSGLWTFLYFVAFCLLTNKWTKTEEKWLKHHKVESWQENNARSAIVFSLISTALWAGITFIALQRFRLNQAGMGMEEGQMGAAPGGDMSGAPGSTMYTGMPDQTGQQQQQPPMQQQQQQQQPQSYGAGQAQMSSAPGMGGGGGSYYTGTH